MQLSNLKIHLSLSSNHQTWKEKKRHQTNCTMLQVSVVIICTQFFCEMASWEYFQVWHLDKLLQLEGKSFLKGLAFLFHCIHFCSNTFKIKIKCRTVSFELTDNIFKVFRETLSFLCLQC